MKTVLCGLTARQRGAALVVCLVFLLVMTILGVTNLLVTAREETMAGNLRDRNLAFQAAESALRAGEARTQNQTQPLIFNCPTSGGSIPGLYLHNCPADVLSDSFWGTEGNRLTYAGGSLAPIASNPLYVIEKLPGVSSSLEAGVAQNYCCFRVTARGTGGTGNAVVIVQSTFKP